MATDFFTQLIEIMARLRGEKGCPWDREQTHQSLRQFLLEETYEVLETIDQNDLPALKEELGDLLLQIVFHAQIASEEQQFNIHDVVQSINEKLIRRHPNVFGEVKIKSAAEQVRNWERLKKTEGRLSVIAGIPKELPALLRAHRLQTKAAQVGFDWAKIDEVWNKVHEELVELKDATTQNDPEKTAEEFGDLLFSLVNLARFLQLNPEDTLRLTIEKFSRRFEQIEQELKRRGKTPEQSTLVEMDEIWNRVKKGDKIKKRTDAKKTVSQK